MTSPLSNHNTTDQTHSLPQHHTAQTASVPTTTSKPPKNYSLGPPPIPASNNKTPAASRSVTLVLPSSNRSSSVDFSTPSSASSATTSFQQPDRKVSLPVDGGEASRGRRTEVIEMDQVAPAGHRRRRSTLTSSVGGAGGPPSAIPAGRSRAQSIRKTTDPALEGKISEEQTGEPSKPEDSDDDKSLSDEDLHDDEETGLTKKDKKRKRAKKRRNTRLDNRIAREHISEEERKEADQNVARKIAVNCVLIGLCLVLYFVPSLRPGAGHNSDMGRSRHETEPERPIMTKLFYLTRIGPCGAATGLDIGLGNASLKFITLTFYTMCKSSSLAFVLLFAFLFKLEIPTWKLVGIIATMTLGVVMMVAGEVEFKLNGFILVISAAFFSGFRWGLTQILLLRNPATSNPFSSIFYLAPVMFLTLIIIAIPVEGFPQLIEGLKALSETWGPVRAPLILIFPGTIAFLMTASEFALLKRSSVVTLSIAGIFKEVVTISAAALVFDDRLTPINISGLVVTIGAIVCYNWIKLTKMRNDAQLEAHNKHGYQQAESGSSSDGSDGEEEESGLLAHSEGEDERNMITMDGDIIPNPKPHAEEPGP
ncbi:transporter C22E12.01 [Seiridium cupressi]